MSTATPLSALPGSSTDAGTGPAVVELFETLLDDASIAPGATPDAVTAALSSHREHLAAWYGDLVGPLVVPASAAEAFSAALGPSDHALRILLVADPAGAADTADGDTSRQLLRGARDLLAEDDRVQIVGVRLGLPAGPAGPATGRLLDSLDFSVPTWVRIGAEPGADQALAVLAADGAENLALQLDGALPPQQAAVLVRQAIDLDLTFRLAGDPLDVITRAGALGWLNALGAVRAALNGAEAREVAQVLAATDEAPLTSGLRRMSEADAAVSRAFLAAVAIPDVAATVQRLVALGLLTPPA